MKDADAERQKLVTALGRVARGDRSALREVYDMTSAKLFGVCLRISADREAAEDILQDVYVKVWKRADRFDSGRSSPITWLCAIARNAAIDWSRASRRTDATGRAALPEAAAGQIADDALPADELIEQDQLQARMAFCLDQLEHRQRESIRAAFLDGLTYVELAERMAVPLGTMKSWIRRGMQRLKECIGDA
ncbi:sigma-70 family RNA polymerase sigma factor [Novosphingobium sp. BL-8H]|uniref:sigma-70 family RNA polymerase sigma factor n=1 Tax=Novosphingobium sp. BL-8H TaxID=3127640 RepID=UPI0037579F0B